MSPGSRFRPRHLIVIVAGAVAAVALSPASGTSPMPLARYPGFGYTDDVDQQRFDEEEAQRQALVEGCMTSQGFQYTPRPVSPTDPSPEDLAEMHELATLPELDDLAAAGSESAYYLALHGKADPVAAHDPSEIDLDGNGAVDYLENFGGGCEGDAYRAIPGVFFRANVLREELARLEREIVGSADARAVDADWLGCMRELGHSGRSRRDVLEEADERRAAGEAIERVEALAHELDEAQLTCDRERDAELDEVRRAAEARFVEEHRHVLEGPGDVVAAFAAEHAAR